MRTTIDNYTHKENQVRSNYNRTVKNMIGIGIILATATGLFYEAYLINKGKFPHSLTYSSHEHPTYDAKFYKVRP
jgi:hypothetical protein